MQIEDCSAMICHGSKIKCDLATAASAAVRLKATFLDQTV
jgi:L-cysteine desulfidase